MTSTRFCEAELETNNHAKLIIEKVTAEAEYVTQAYAVFYVSFESHIQRRALDHYTVYTFILDCHIQNQDCTRDWDEWNYNSE